MGESLYGADAYGAGKYSQSPYVTVSVGVTASYALSAIPQRIKDAAQAISTTFVVAAIPQRIKDATAPITAAYVVSVQPERVISALADVSAVFGLHAQANYTASGEAAMAVECTVTANYSAGRFWVDTNAPGNWTDNTPPDVTWVSTSSEQWNG